MKAWQVQEAKAKFSDLIHNAKLNPQLITVRGHPEAVVISIKQYSKFSKPDLSLFEVMQKFPHPDLKIATKRSKNSKLREIIL